VKYRPEPNTSKTESATYNPGDVLNFVGFTRGENVSGNNIWFKGIGGGYVWSGGLTDGSTAGLADLTPASSLPTPVTPVAPVTPAPQPTPPLYPAEENPEDKSTVSPDGLKTVTEWIPAHEDNFQVGNFPANPTDAVIHQFGALGIGINSVISYFQMSLADRIAGELRAHPNKVPTVGPSSSHFVIEDDRIVQMVKLSSRAYHAGKGGNDFIGIETSPNQSAKTIASVNRLLGELYSRGFKVKLWLHKNVPGNATECGSLINLANYRSELPAPVVPAPVVVPTPAVPTGVTLSADSLALIEKHIKSIEDILHEK
jgi:hypothetical protein